ncbi:MAG: hypothetical protein ACRD9L_10740, partial [Bryobacteraceae bacterium]
MKLAAAAAVALAWSVGAHAQTGSGAEPVRYMGGVPINLYAPEGNLRPAIGVENRQVFRANRTHPEMADGFGWTYNHAPMLAYWNGKFYLEYLSDPVGEQRMPGQTLLITSSDGRAWSKPAVVFPVYGLKDGKQAIMHQRMGFYVTPEGRLLVLAFYGHDPSPFNMGGIGRVVREAHKDGTFGPIYFIRYNRHAGWNETNTSYPFYKTSPDNRQRIAVCAVVDRIVNQRVPPVFGVLAPDLCAAHDQSRQLDRFGPRKALIERQRGERMFPQRHGRAVRPVIERERLEVAFYCVEIIRALVFLPPIQGDQFVPEQRIAHRY